MSDDGKSKFEKVTRLFIDAPGKMKRTLVGAPRDIQDPHLFHKVSLIAFMAWVGLGADGLSSSAYGPDEAFKALGDFQQATIAQECKATAAAVEEL